MKKPLKMRLDQLLVERGLFASRAKAQAAIMAGQVLVAKKAAVKAGSPTAADAELSLAAVNPYVSRGGLKLDAALKSFGIDPRGRVCLDLGSSTGGFTDRLLQGGAEKVYAVDVGTAQLDVKLRGDRRVVSRERTHAGDLRPGDFSPRPDLAVVDVSFISLTLVLPRVTPCLAAPFQIVALIKPQFELAPKQTPKGIVRTEEHRRLAVERVRGAAQGLSLREMGLLQCPIRGAKGNVEFFMHLRSPGLPPFDP